MPWEKGNTCWKDGVKAKKEKQDKLDEFLLILASGGTEKYGDMMDKLMNDGKVSKAQQQYMDRFEGWREYVKPKLAKSEKTVTHKGINNLLDKLNGDNAES